MSEVVVYFMRALGLRVLEHWKYGAYHRHEVSASQKAQTSIAVNINMQT